MSTRVIEKGGIAKQFVTASLCILLITGCSISVPQADSSYRVMKDLFFSDGESFQEQDPSWLASVGDHGAVLRPYLSGSLTVFANTDGDAIAFDGWTIRSVVGFGMQHPLSIIGRDGVRIFTVAGHKTQTNCEKWYRAGLVWSQRCSNGLSEIVLDDEGNIQKITMAISDSAIVTLRVAK